MNQKIRVLVVDDSQTMRTLITTLLSKSTEIEVVGSAADAYSAREKLVALKPDVMTLDLEMPKMNGILFLEKVMKFFPTRTIVISSHSVKSSLLEKKLLKIGAVGVISKPRYTEEAGFKEKEIELIRAVTSAAKTPLVQREHCPAILADKIQIHNKIIVIASSTGGTEALKPLLMALPKEIPPILIVQHMPPGFTEKFSVTIQNLLPFELREAKDGDTLRPGLALLAPGDFHMELKDHKLATGVEVRVRLHKEPLMHSVRPAADYLFYSAARLFKNRVIGVVLTGMGKDGADGLLKIKEAGGQTIVQDEASSLVFGMPKAAIDAGAAQKTLPLDKIAQEIVNLLSSSKKVA